MAAAAAAAEWLLCTQNSLRATALQTGSCIMRQTPGDEAENLANELSGTMTIMDNN